MTIITRTYATESNAAKAVARLRQEGFPDAQISAPRVAPWNVSIRPVFGMGGIAAEILDRFEPSRRETAESSPDTGSISELSRSVSPGLISALSRSRASGAISSLSRSSRSAAIARLSRSKPAGSIRTLSQSKSPGAISRLSTPPRVNSLAHLSNWFLSTSLGLPLLTRHQGPVEPANTLLVK